MSTLDGAALEPAPDGGPPVTVERSLLDGVPCAAALGPVALLDARVAIRCQDPALGRFLEAVLEAFPPAAEADTVLHLVEVHGQWVAYENGGRSVTVPTVAALARSLVWLLNRLALAAPTDDVLVHAAVAGRDGAAVVLPGRSGTGKSTLVAALAQAGWAYLSDEVAPVGPGGATVRPYPRPLALEAGSWPLLPGLAGRWPPGVPDLVEDLRLLLPATLEGGAARGAAVPAAVVFPEVVAGAATRLEPLGRAEALERLLDLTFNLGDLGRPGFDRLAGCVRRSVCHRLVLDGVDRAPAVLRGVLGTGAGPG